jgi:hypothetical protein
VFDLGHLQGPQRPLPKALPAPTPNTKKGGPLLNQFPVKSVEDQQHEEKLKKKLHESLRQYFEVKTREQKEAREANDKMENIKICDVRCLGQRVTKLEEMMTSKAS